jgi:heme A synthase
VPARSLQDTPDSRIGRDALYASVIGLTALVILFQGVWAGLFIREGKDFDASSSQSRWVEVHDWGARVAIVLAFVSFVVAAWRLRGRKDLLVGTGLLFVLLLAEAYIGGEIGDHASWPSAHIPLAMALMGLSVWLPSRAVRGRGIRSEPEPAYGRERERPPAPARSFSGSAASDR